MQTIRSMRRLCSLHDASARRLYGNRRTRPQSAYVAGYAFELALKAAFFEAAGFDPDLDNVEPLAKKPDSRVRRGGPYELPAFADPGSPATPNPFIQPLLNQPGPLGHRLELWLRLLAIQRTRPVAPELQGAVNAVLPLWSVELRYRETLPEASVMSIMISLRELRHARYRL